MRGLHAKPRGRAISEQLAKPHRDSRRDRLRLAQDVIKVLPGNAEQTGGRNRHSAQFPKQRYHRSMLARLGSRLLSRSRKSPPHSMTGVGEALSKAILPHRQVAPTEDDPENRFYIGLQIYYVLP